LHRSAHRSSAGWTLVGVSRDISERRAQEEKIARLNRVYAVLSGINSLIVRTLSRQDLFRDACRIAVEVGQFRMAMISIGAGDQVKPVAVAGFDEGFVAKYAHLRSSGPSPKGAGPTDYALCETGVLICNDIATDGAVSAWRDAALQRGYGASATFPLFERGILAGCISLYAAEAGFFDEEELKLLSQLAGDVSYALDFIARDEQLIYLAYYDPLTKLANRRLFIDRLAQHLDEVRKTGEMLAAEHFKAINDAVGRAGGDELLKLQAARLLRFTGNTNYLARFGADQFAIVIPNLKHASDMTSFLVEKMRGRLSRPHKLGDSDVRLSFKMGIALFPDDGENAESLVGNAESALKRAKASGEKYLFYTLQMSAALKERLSLESRLRYAVERREFALYYQPKVELIGGLICGAEALLRWESPELGTVLPDNFISLLEDTGLILEVGLWALKQAVDDRARWVSEGLQVPRLSVNVSPAQLKQPDFLESFKTVLSGSAGTDPGIDIEITETMLMTDIDAVITKLASVAELGAKIAIDDFGTGYSSLTYLARLPIHALKIDRSFVVKMSDSSDTMAIVSAIISVSHAMRLKVIAEGVDSPEQFKLLRLLLCDEMQGWLFSKALPAQGFAELLREGRRLTLI
jgi:diguanylate cyclase (GGDEF)-like protein